MGDTPIDTVPVPVSGFIKCQIEVRFSVFWINEVKVYVLPFTDHVGVYVGEDALPAAVIQITKHLKPKKKLINK